MFKIGLDPGNISESSYSILGILFVHHGAKVEPNADGVSVVFPPHRSDGADTDELDLPVFVMDLLPDSTSFTGCPIYAEVSPERFPGIGTERKDGGLKLVRIGDLEDPISISDYLGDSPILYTGRKGQEMLREGYGGEENVTG